MDNGNELWFDGPCLFWPCALLLRIDLTDLCHCLLAVGDGFIQNIEAIDVIKAVYSIWALLSKLYFNWMFGEQANLFFQFFRVSSWCCTSSWSFLISRGCTHRPHPWNSKQSHLNTVDLHLSSSAVIIKTNLCSSQAPLRIRNSEFYKGHLIGTSPHRYMDPVIPQKVTFLHWACEHDWHEYEACQTPKNKDHISINMRQIF